MPLRSALRLLGCPYCSSLFPCILSTLGCVVMAAPLWDTCSLQFHILFCLFATIAPPFLWHGYSFTYGVPRIALLLPSCPSLLSWSSFASLRAPPGKLGGARHPALLHGHHPLTTMPHPIHTVAHPWTRTKGLMLRSRALHLLCAARALPFSVAQGLYVRNKSAHQ